MEKCKCVNSRFYAHQQCYHDIIVDDNNIFLRDKRIYESNKPYGLYTCIECDREYEGLPK